MEKSSLSLLSVYVIFFQLASTVGSAVAVGKWLMSMAGIQPWVMVLKVVTFCAEVVVIAGEWNGCYGNLNVSRP